MTGKSILKLTGFIAGIGGLLFLSLFLFVRMIATQRGCEAFNIDNIEMHAKVDVLKIISSDCGYDESTLTKTAFFKVDLDKLKPNYITVNKFQPLEDFSEIEGFTFIRSEEINENSSNLYIKKHQYKGEKTIALFDETSGNLWVTINYAD